MFLCFYMHSNVGHRGKRKSLVGKKINYLTAVTGYWIATCKFTARNNIYQYTKAYMEILRWNHVVICINISSRTCVAMRQQLLKISVCMKLAVPSYTSLGILFPNFANRNLSLSSRNFLTFAACVHWRLDFIVYLKDEWSLICGDIA